MIVGNFSNFFRTYHFYRLFCVDETNQKETQGSCVLVTLACTMCVLSLDSGKAKMNAFKCRFIHLPASIRLGFATLNVSIWMCARVTACLPSISIKWYYWLRFFLLDAKERTQTNTHMNKFELISSTEKLLLQQEQQNVYDMKWNMMRTVLSDSIKHFDRFLQF